jgi:predicted DNA-binding transcriptional regulator AlpA
MPTDALLVDAKTAAQMLALSERTLWSLSQPRGPIPAVRIPGSRLVRYCVDDLRAWVAGAKCKTAAAEVSP